MKQEISFEDKYYDPQRMLSYNRIMSFVIGARGIGKSFSMKQHAIRRFIKHGEQFVYIKRYKSDLSKIATYFSDIEHHFPEHEFKVKGREFWIDGKLAGYNIPLSSWQNEKSNAYPNVSLIVYDEFIKEKDNSSYLPNEVDALLNLMDTIFRNRENVRCVCLSNSVSLSNPYFVYFGIAPDLSKRFNNYESILIEIPASKEFKEERIKTRFGKLISETPYGSMSLDNDFVDDNDTFISQRNSDAKYVFSVIYKGREFGFWVDDVNWVLYMSNKFDPSHKERFVLMKEDMSTTSILVMEWRRNYYLYKMVKAFKTSKLRFEDIYIRKVAYEIFKKMGIN